MPAGFHPSGTEAGFRPVLKTGLFLERKLLYPVPEQSDLRCLSFTPACWCFPGCHLFNASVTLNRRAGAYRHFPVYIFFKK